jgi:hypothetical protein
MLKKPLQSEKCNSGPAFVENALLMKVREFKFPLIPQIAQRYT